jgi:hypothetical protein
METKVEQLTQIQNETSVLLKELKPIVNDLFEVDKGDICILHYKSMCDDNYTEALKLTWGSLEYIESLSNIIKSHKMRIKCYLYFENVSKVIEKYKDCNSGILLSEGEKKRILNYTYSVFMLNEISAELQCLILVSN